MLIGPEWLLPAARAVKWLSDFGRDDLHEVKQEISGLLNELWASYRADLELKNQILSVQDKEFRSQFPDIHRHWHDAYFDSDDFKRTRTHCGEIRRRVESVKFKLVRVGRTNLGKWGEIDQYFRELMDADDLLTGHFVGRLNLAKVMADKVLRTYSSSKKAALAEFKAFKAKIESEDAENKRSLNEMELAFEAIKNKMR